VCTHNAQETCQTCSLGMEQQPGAGIDVGVLIRS
jgi:hypothetical protein